MSQNKKNQHTAMFYRDSMDNYLLTAIRQMYESEKLEIMNDNPKQEYFLMSYD